MKFTFIFRLLWGFLYLILLLPFVVSGQSFKLTCNDKTIPVFEQNDVPFSFQLNAYKYSRVTYFEKPLLLEVTASGFEFSDDDWEISPHSYNIKGIKVATYHSKIM